MTGQQVLLTRNFFERAESEFERFVTDYPLSTNRARAVLYQAQSRHFLKKYDAVVELLDKNLAEAGPLADDYVFWKGEALKEKGDQAPNFELKGSDGKTYRLEQFKGEKPVVIAWFPKAFTSGCTAECKSMKEDGEKIRNYNVAYFTASVDDPETNRKFAESLELDYPILSDPAKETARSYGVLNDRGMANRWTFYIGKDGKILHVDRGVKAAQHGSDIAARLEQLGVEEKQS